MTGTIVACPEVEGNHRQGKEVLDGGSQERMPASWMDLSKLAVVQAHGSLTRIGGGPGKGRMYEDIDRTRLTVCFNPIWRVPRQE